MFKNGTWSDLEQIRPANDCTIDNRDDKWYIVTWTRPKAKPLSVAIPINYELLANSTRKEMEQNFSRNLQRHRPKAQNPVIPEINELDNNYRDGILVRRGHSFMIPEINSDTYYRLALVREQARTNVRISKNVAEDITFEAEMPTLVVDTRYPKETLADILLAQDNTGFDIILSLTLLYAGYHKETMKVGLRQWQSYCQSVGCTPYFIYEGAKDNQAAAILLMHNRNEGYAHLLFLHADISQLEKPSQVYQGRVYMYIPTSNIKELFAKAAAGKSSPKTYEQ